MTGRIFTWLLICLCFVSVRIATAQSNTAPSSSAFDLLMGQDMFYGADDYFGENADLIYADIVTPEGGAESQEQAVVATTNDDDDEDDSDSSDDSAGSGDSSGGDGSDAPIDIPDVGDPPDVGGGGDDCPS